MKILIVDGDMRMCEILGDWLIHRRHEVLAVENGDRALAALRSQHFDLVITDFRMPGGVDGIDVIAEGKKLHPTTVFSLHTSFMSPLDVERAEKNGATHIFMKPTSQIEFMNALRL